MQSCLFHCLLAGLGCLISLLETSTDLAELLNCVSSNLQALVFQVLNSQFLQERSGR